MTTSCGMNESWLDILLRAAAMRFNASWLAFVRTETGVARDRYRHEMARMNRVLIARRAPGITPLAQRCDHPIPTCGTTSAARINSHMCAISRHDHHLVHFNQVGGTGVSVVSGIGCGVVKVHRREAVLHLCIPSPDSSPRRTRLTVSEAYHKHAPFAFTSVEAFGCGQTTVSRGW
jgi:hypothetical protein